MYSIWEILADLTSGISPESNFYSIAVAYTLTLDNFVFWATVLLSETVGAAESP